MHVGMLGVHMGMLGVHMGVLGVHMGVNRCGDEPLLAEDLVAHAGASQKTPRTKVLYRGSRPFAAIAALLNHA